MGLCYLDHRRGVSIKYLLDPQFTINIRWDAAMDANLGKETLKSDLNLLIKGQRIIYEGEEAEVICAKPLLTLKIKGRIICGSLHGKIELIKESHN